MKRFHCLVLFLILKSIAFSQKAVPDFGKPDPEDFRIKSCEFEPGADAMKIFDIEEVEFESFQSGFTRMTTERRIRIKIFNEKGYRYASIRIPYFSKKGVTKMKDLAGVIYNTDASGKIVAQKIDKKDFFKEKAEYNVGIINFTFPNLKPGSVIEFRYKKIEKNFVQIEPWVAQDQIPIAYASAAIIIPSSATLKEKIMGADTIEQKIETLRSSGHSREKRTYFREKIPSFQPEPFMTSFRDNLLNVIFMLIPGNRFFFFGMPTSPVAGWEFTGKSLSRSPYFGQLIKQTIAGTEKLIDSAKAISSLPERISFIYENVKKRASTKAEQTMYADNIDEAWENRSANTAEANLMLLNLLEKSEVQCYPLLISTRENGKVNTQFPAIGQFNGVDVVAWDSSKFLIMDASLKYQSSQTPPFNIMNTTALLLKEDTVIWLTIQDDRPLIKQNINIRGEFKENGTIEGTAYCWYYDYAKSYLLDSTINENDDDKKMNDKKPEGLTIRSTNRENVNDDSKPLLQIVEFTYTPQQTGNFYFINPQLLAEKKENPFKKETRNTDIDLGCNQQLSLKIELKIPAGFEVDNVPKSIVVRAPDSSFFYRRVTGHDTATVFLSQTFDINQSFFFRDEYPALREFFQRVYGLMAEEITIKRKK